MASLPRIEDAFVPPDRLSAARFELTAMGHRMRRAIIDLAAGEPRRIGKGNRLADAPVLAEIVSPLWDDGRKDEFPLLAGKVENLRRAVRAFDTIEIAAGELVGFWAQLGPPWRLRGFVEGREVREGCVIPAVAGGLCQLSNALARAAQSAGIAIVERHAHTARIELANSDAGDSTVFWNYVDLRLRPAFACRIQARLSANSLHVLVRGEVSLSAQPRPVALPSPLPRNAARGCLTCGETACFRQGRHSHLPRRGRTALLLGEMSPEFQALIADRWPNAERCEPWLRSGRAEVGSWRLAGALLARPRWPGIRRSALLRINPAGGQRQAAVLKADAWLARSYARHLRPEHDELVISQPLLAPLHRLGVLGGRRYSVLAGALPAGEIERRLDAAFRARPGAVSLADFRADPAWIAAELEALQGAQRIFTPHAAVASHLKQIGLAPVENIGWTAPTGAPGRSGPVRPVPVIGFPASDLPRKGACELADAARRLGWAVVIGGTMSGNPQLWGGVSLSHHPMRAPGWLDGVDIVVLPAHVEHTPRMALRALALQIPVVASEACGLGAHPGLIEVPAGDVAALVRACRDAAARAGYLTSAPPAQSNRRSIAEPAAPALAMRAVRD